ncbi:hypothetical protein RhiirA1_56182 [Rhizophagus irregularis]|uniref:Uncharacterized protein n=2 Tax=Rhizophagus irregularis TaxID=588596 RepID=A0A2N0R5R1_9GLOM|nr:hypothetical protein GLOIN_2v1583755 [Rhizophagus irregularis DAOM 181602=DAOM 197198]PKC58623.1 hypothetical protein RhiirA1_56182 [Rhizophagus irregularis]POG73628.1 hypothetical protein GLOIN_2v1583755 [Rhizophagus irregularis DAOM 181602=DAOM 197198]|eukprot:XP_025180494.1 hypothetical protein GLOIN_2v1583755 [Rhizophagus irregularis DAOM 181602=DAOM 197198]
MIIPIDVRAYFQIARNKLLIYPFLPCVVVRRDIFHPLEVCDVIPVNYVIHLAISHNYKNLFSKQKKNILYITGSTIYEETEWKTGGRDDDVSLHFVPIRFEPGSKY